MIRSALLLFAGVLVAACFACVAATLPPQASFRPKLADCPTGAGLADRVYELQVTTRLFNAVQYAACDDDSCQWPPPSRGNPAAAYASTIKDAFDLAPVFFQNELCSLETVYIVTDPTLQSNNPRMWGMRERARGGLKHIAISSTVLNDPDLQEGPGKSPYANYETKTLHSLLASALPGDWNSGQLKYVSTEPRRAMAILAILAHEMGHVVWWSQDVVNKPIGGGRRFYSFSWRNAFTPATPRFREFGMNAPGDVPVGPDLQAVKADLTNPGDPTHSRAVTDLLKIYDRQSVGGTQYSEWPSLFATVAPDEDFVETFKLWVLTYDDATTPTSTRLTSLSIQIPTAAQPIDIISRFQNNDVLFSKRMWIANTLSWKY
jgi:hypothetical protein